MTRPPRRRPPSRRTREKGPQGALIVGVGASAGGLEALQELLRHVPAKSGLPFVVVQHLEPHHPSMLAELLARHAPMPVLVAGDGVRPERDHVYVVAPRTLLTLENGVLRAAPTGPRRAPHRRVLPVARRGPRRARRRGIFSRARATTAPAACASSRSTAA